VTTLPSQASSNAQDWRRGLWQFYRIVTAAVAAVAALLVVIGPAAGAQREPFYTISAVIGFGIPLVGLPSFAKSGITRDRKADFRPGTLRCRALSFLQLRPNQHQENLINGRAWL